MLAFEVAINGKRRYLAGHEDARSLILLVSGDCFVRDAHAMTSVIVPYGGPADSATLSYESDPLSVGDEMTVRVVDVEKPDPPVHRNDGEGSYRIELGTSE
jgi:hypothetical protein